MRKNSVPVASLPGADAPSRTRDNKDFMARWIPYGMALKAKADGYGIEWRNKSFEQLMSEIVFAETWHESEDQCARM